jgi:acyl-CoA thioesterase-1
MSTIQRAFTSFGAATRNQRSRIRGGVALLLALTVGLSASRAAAQVRIPTHVACVGDSITAGFAASSVSAAYPSVLQTLLGTSVQVRNFGHSGATMMSVADLPYQNQTEYTDATTFVSGAGATAVVDVILMLGTNDSKSYNWIVGTGTRAQQFVTDCAAMVDHFASLPTHPLVYLALPPRAFANTYGISGTIIHDQMLPLLQQVAAAKGLPVIDVDTPTAPHPELFPDGVHPNDTGYALVAQVMHDGLLSALPAGTGDGGATDARGVDAGGSGGSGAGGAGAGAGGRGAGGAAGASVDAGLSDADTSAHGGTGGASGGATGGDAGTGTGTSSGSGCSCRLAITSVRGDSSDASFLLFAAVAVVSLRARRRRWYDRQAPSDRQT